MCLFDCQCATMTPADDAHGPQTPLHEPVMVREVLDLLQPGPAARVLDCTLGTAGHALALAERLGPDGLLVGLDADSSALALAGARLAGVACRVSLHCTAFSRAPLVASELGIRGFDAVIADLGMGTHQLGDPERGLAFDSSARLDMRYDRSSGGLTAWDVINTFSERELADLFFGYGEERWSRQIAAEICRRRPIETPAELAALIKRVAARRTPRRQTWRIHPATRVLMSVRAFVNRELDELDALLAALPGLLAPAGRAVVITYQSLEARRVKQAWRSQQAAGLIEALTSSPLTPSAEEVARNPRARSAQLRAALRTRRV